MEHKLKTLAVQEIIERAKKNPANDQRDIDNFLKQIPEKSDYLIENLFLGNSRVAEPICFRPSTQTFAKHISLDKLNNNCHLILSEAQFETLRSFQL